MNTDWKKNIVLFLTSQTISLFGSSLVQYAILWHITLNTQSGVMMTISIICGFVPMFLLSPFAGVWADRYSRKWLIVISDSLIAVSTLIMAILFLLGYDSMWLLFVVSAIRSLGGGVQTPAVAAMLPQLVPEDKLTRIGGINGSIQAMVMLLSPMLSGALLSMASIEAIFFIDVITAAIAVATLFLFVQVPLHAKAGAKQAISYFADMRLGFDYIRQHAYIKSFFIFCAFFFVLAAPVSFLTPLQVTRTFGEDIWRLTAIEITFSIGMMLGGLLMAAWPGFRNRVHTMTMSAFAVGLCTFALGLIPVFWIYLGVMAVVGLALPFFNTPSTVLLQEKVEPDYLGRVFGVLGMISSSMMPLGMLVFGPLADMVRIEWLLMITGLLMFVQGFFLLGNKVLISAGNPAAAAAESSPGSLNGDSP
ncbi:MFS transporter [Paenibacillus sp. MMS20-IR301]|uniref:MFS transporter n=1 Tax=Paenibacillus sp. MMS20-IR301 TaxID=2895946 RepID=UPI0028EE437F|nr:MFS transporter [Paenibacillus sp. MMS20-IR301]WNS41440.1 MFS transporter [Paenibacillus sp. MMS20-IR301]